MAKESNKAAIDLDDVISKALHIHEECFDEDNVLESVQQSPWALPLLSLSLAAVNFVLRVRASQMNDQVNTSLRELKKQVKAVTKKLAGQRKNSNRDEAAVWLESSAAILFHDILGGVISKEFLPPLQELKKGVGYRLGSLNHDVQTPSLQNAETYVAMHSQISKTVSSVLAELSEKYPELDLETILTCLGNGEIQDELSSRDQFLAWVTETLITTVDMLVQEINGQHSPLAENAREEVRELVDHLVRDPDDSWTVLRGEKDPEVISTVMLHAATTILKAMNSEDSSVHRASNFLREQSKG